jgi:hypothetical protein
VHWGAWRRDEGRITARPACEEGEGASGTLMGKVYTYGLLWEGGGATFGGDGGAGGPLPEQTQILRAPVLNGGLGTLCPHLGCATEPCGALCI